MSIGTRVKYVLNICLQNPQLDSKPWSLCELQLFAHGMSTLLSTHSNCHPPRQAVLDRGSLASGAPRRQNSEQHLHICQVERDSM